MLEAIVRLRKQGATGSILVSSTNHLKTNHLRKLCLAVSAILGIWEQ
jgi:hypothetical protein